MEKKENKEAVIEKGKKFFRFIFGFLFIIIFSFFYFDYGYPELFPLNTTSYITKRTLKFILAIILNLSNLYINFKTKGFKSGRTFFSIFSLFSTIFFIVMFYNEDLRELFKQVVGKIVQTGLTIKALGDIYMIQRQYLDIFGRTSYIGSFFKKPDKENVMMIKSSSEQKGLNDKLSNERNTNVKSRQLNSSSKVEKKKENIFNDRKFKIKEKKQLISEPNKYELKGKFFEDKKKEVNNIQKKKGKLDSGLENKERRKIKKQLNGEKKGLYYHTPEGLRKQRLKQKAFSIKLNRNFDYDEFDPLWNKLTDGIDEPSSKKENIRNLDSERKEEEIEGITSKDTRKKYTDELIKRRKISKVKYFINEKGERVYYRKLHKSCYTNYGKYKIVPSDINIVKMKYPKYLADKGALRKILSSSSPNKIQIKMYEKQNPLNILPRIPEYSELDNVINYMPTLEKVKERELILIRLILLRVTYFEDNYVSGDLLSQLIEVQSKRAYLEKKLLNPEENIGKKKNKIFNLKLFNNKAPKLREIEQEYAYLEHPSVSVLTSGEEYKKGKDESIVEKKSIFKKGLSFLKNFGSSTSNVINIVAKPSRPLLPNIEKYNSLETNPPKLILTSHEELYKLYYGERKLRPYEIPAKNIIMQTDVTINYRNEQYKNGIINLEAGAAQHAELLISVAEHKDLKEIASRHQDYIWLHKKYLRELHERAIAMKKSQFMLNDKKNKTLPAIEKIKYVSNVKVDKDLPPLPLLRERNTLFFENDNQNVKDNLEQNLFKEKNDKKNDKDNSNERGKLFEELFVKGGKEAEESKNGKKSIGPVISSKTELEDLEEDLPVLPFRKSKQDSIKQLTDNVLTDIVEEGIVRKEESEKLVNEAKSVTVEDVIDEEYGSKEESIKIEKEESQKENKEATQEERPTKLVKSIEEMTADELEEFLAPEIKRRQEMSDYGRKEIEDICGKIPDEEKKYGDKGDEVTPHILKLKRGQEYYERNAYRLEPDYYNPERFPDPVEDPESTVPSESGSDTESIGETISERDTDSLKSNKSNKESLRHLKNENVTSSNEDKNPTSSDEDKNKLGNNKSTNSEKESNIMEVTEPELVIEYTPNYYHGKELMGEDALLVRQIKEKCRQEAIRKVEAAKAAVKLIEDKRIAEELAKEKARQNLIDNGIDPDNPNELGVNGKAVETVCIAILDRAIGGLDYKVNKIDGEREGRDNAHILRLDLDMAWDTIFNGGSYEEKLGPDFYENVEKRREIGRKRVEIIELKNIFIGGRDSLKVMQAKNIIGLHYTDRELSDLDDERIFGLQEIVDNPKRQTEVIKYIQDYVNRVNTKKVRKEDLTHEQVIHFVEIYLTQQKPGLLNLKPFKEMKPDFMTLRYVDYFLEFRENEKKRWAEQKIQAKRDAELKAAQLAAERAKRTPEEIKAQELAEEEYGEKEKEGIVQKEAEIAQLKKEVAEYHLEQQKKQEKNG